MVGAIVDELRINFRVAVRTLVKSPGFAVAAVAILALGIGANTLLFTFFSAYLMKPLPVQDPERHVTIMAKLARGRQTEVWSYPDFAEFRAQNRALEEMYGWAEVDVPVRDPAPRKLKATLVSGNYFRLFHAGTVLGRTFSESEDAAPGRDAVVVLSHHAWYNVFNADPRIVGRTLRIRQTVFTIVGVANPAFTGVAPFGAPDLWAPLTMRDQIGTTGMRLADADYAWLRVGGMLKPRLSPAQAADSMQATVAELNTRRSPAAVIERVQVDPQSGYVPLAGEVLAAVIFVSSAFGMVLLIGCANLAGVLLARGAARQRELAVRVALGATRGRLIRQLLAESVLLCAAAAAASLLLIQTGTGAVQRYLCTLLIKEGYTISEISPDWRVFLFAALLALSAGIVLGLGPALEATRTDLMEAVKTGSGSRPNSRSRRLREMLVAGQVAASLVLLVVAGIFIRNAQRVTVLDPGIEIQRVISVRADGPKRQLIQRLRTDPRVEAVSEAFRSPIGPHGLFYLPARVGERTQGLGFNYVDSEYFDAVRLPIQRGRGFTASEARAQARVVVVSAATARRLWPSEDPIGKSIEVLEPKAGERYAAGTYEVIGTVPDVISGVHSGRPDRSALYLPAPPNDARNAVLLVRSRDVSPATLADIKKMCADADGVGACDPVTLREIADRLRFPFLAAGGVSTGVGLLAILMTCIGLYGVVAFTVVQRTREIGIRMALGAAPANVLRSVVTRAVRQVSIGIATGLPLCYIFSKIAALAFYVIETFDVVAYIATPLFLIAVTLAAAWIPARRAIRIDPLIALRQD